MTLDKDYAGIIVSTLCFLHCVAGPVILAMGLTSVGYSFLLDEKIHLILVVPIVLFAAWSIPSGYEVHQKKYPAIAAIIGVVLLFLGLLIENFEVILTLVASSLLIFAHFSNKRLLKSKH